MKAKYDSTLFFLIMLYYDVMKIDDVASYYINTSH